MGTTAISIHVFSDAVPKYDNLRFASLSQGWYTCISVLDQNDPPTVWNTAKHISKTIDAPVLYFSIYDSDSITISFYQDGKLISEYTDSEMTPNKKLRTIPLLVGYDNSDYKRLSSILLCSDAEVKTSMLEEYFGVFLPFTPDLLDLGLNLNRERNDVIFREYIEAESVLTGESAPISLKLISTVKGKLFERFFGTERDIKEHYFLYGYATEETGHKLTPIYFSNGELNTVELSEFNKDRVPQSYNSNFFVIDYGNGSVSFTDHCPPAYRGKKLKLPKGFYPRVFLAKEKLVLEGNHRLFIIDESLKVISKLTIKGELADINGEYLLTTVGDSFCGYTYEKGAKVHIYKIIYKKDEEIFR